MRDLTSLLAAIAALEVASLAPAIRDELAGRWADDALGEHASIAAFSRFSLELLAVGAPPGLVAATHEAALDEIAHARLAFAIASAYAGVPLGPGALVPATTDLVRTDLAALVEAAAREGCVDETAAALIAAAERDACTAPVIREVLAIVARDEAAHAALAWRFASWAIATGGDVARAAFERGLGTRGVFPTSDAPSPLAAHGRLGPEARAHLLGRATHAIHDAREQLLADPDAVLARWIGAAP